MRAVVDCCARELLTSHGLRSLSPRDPAYRGEYLAIQWQRDAAYHQGPCGVGCSGRSRWRITGFTGMRERPSPFSRPWRRHLERACVGSVSEIFDGDAPHIARGCFAQAWSVAEILRAWKYLERMTVKP